MGKLLNCQVDISSTNLESLSWDSKTNKLIITFKGGNKYSYSEFFEADLLKFLNADSMGKYFHSEIRSKFVFEKLGG